MKTTKKVLKEVEEIVDAFCNKCGESCRGKHSPNLDGLIEVKVDCGYGSILGDGNIYEFSLCEKCLTELFATFKHPALKCNYLFPEESMDGTFLIVKDIAITEDEFKDWTEWLIPFMKDEYGDLILEPIRKEKSWRVRGNYGALWALQQNEELKKVGFIIAEEISGN